jgi:DNA-binding IclR family transcriptional regulator
MTLVSVGALERSGGGYRLGLGLFELGEKVARRRALREAALPFLEDLYERWHETVHLAVLDGPEVLYIERITGHRAINIPSLVGERLPAHCTGVGKALLAFRPEALAALERKRLPGRTRYSIRVWSVLLEEMERIRAEGVAFDREEGVLGVNCVAAPVVIGREAVAAVSVTGPVGRFDPRLAEDSVRRAASSIRSALSKRRPARPA